MPSDDFDKELTVLEADLSTVTHYTVGTSNPDDLEDDLDTTKLYNKLLQGGYSSDKRKEMEEKFRLDLKRICLNRRTAMEAAEERRDLLALQSLYSGVQSAFSSDSE